jgi:hypothetical protein
MIVEYLCCLKDGRDEKQRYKAVTVTTNTKHVLKDIEVGDGEEVT